VVWVQADDIQNEAKELARVRAYVYSQVAKKTGQSVEKVRKQFFQALALHLLQCGIFSHCQKQVVTDIQSYIQRGDLLMEFYFDCR
jgi:hypothetical protein